SCHFEPTGISCRASVQPLMTSLTPNVTGFPPCFSELSNSLPSRTVPLGLHLTLSVPAGFGPAPAFSTLYCSPLGSVCTPSLLLLEARKSSPCFLLAAAIVS